MNEFLAAQPPEYRDHVTDLLSRDAIEMAVMLRLDFASEAVLLCNRNIPFTDLQFGHEWGAGAGLLVGVPQVQGGEGNLAPNHEFRLGMPHEWIDAENWAAELVEMRRNVTDYRGRDGALYGQLFDSDGAGAAVPVGYPFAFLVGIMGQMTVAFRPAGAIVKLRIEGPGVRQLVPVHGMQTYQAQKRLYPTDEGMQFVAEVGKLGAWTDW